MQIFSIRDITRYIKLVFEKDRTLSSVYVRGEISNFKRHYSGHCYFTLKDSEATIRSVMFRGRAQLLKFEPRDGMKVVVGGQITVFERDGQYQLYVDHLIPEGVGELSLAFAQLKERLATEGLFDEERKKRLPLLPRKVGLITSPTGAALRDMITVAKRRHPNITLLVYPVQVQGSDASGQIAHAIAAMNHHGQADVLIVGRGGGSLEELWAFNDEQVVRAIAASVIPVVSAVGHETDYTLADFVADRRAATPSQAAEFAVPDVVELTRYIEALRTMMTNHTVSLLKEFQHRVSKCRQSATFQRPFDLLSSKQQTVDTIRERLRQIVAQQVHTKQHTFRLFSGKLAMLNPLDVLSRGYSITRTLNKQVVRQASQVTNNQEVEIILAQGTLRALVLTNKEANSRG